MLTLQPSLPCQDRTWRTKPANVRRHLKFHHRASRADSRNPTRTGSPGHVVQSESVLPPAQPRCSERRRTTRTATSGGPATVHPPTATTSATSTVWLPGYATAAASSSSTTAAGRCRGTAAQLDAAAATDAVPEFCRRSPVHAPAAPARYPTTATTAAAATTTTTSGGTSGTAQHGGGRTTVAVRAART